MANSTRRTVGVRELRQNASSLLEELLATGESVTITNHGKPVAVLQPMTPDLAWREQLIAEGKLQPGRGRFGTLKPVRLTSDAGGTAALLDDLKADRL